MAAPQYGHFLDVFPAGADPFVPDPQPDPDLVGDQHVADRQSPAQYTAARQGAAASQRSTPVAVLDPEAAKPIATSAAQPRALRAPAARRGW